MYKLALAVAGVLLSSPTWAQTVDLKWNYVGTLEIDLEGGQMVGTRMVFWDKAATFKGPKINATQQQPSGDWVVPQADGSLKLDIRATFKTDDGELLLWEANGVARFLSKEAADRFGNGEQVTGKDAYLFETPRISVASATSKYQWLTQAQLIGKMTTLKPTHVGFDIFSVE